MNWAELNLKELRGTGSELRKSEKVRPMPAANTSIILIQSSHIFLQIILLIISERSIAALNQPELWVHSLCLWHSNSARLYDSQREHRLTPYIFSVCFILFVSLCANMSFQFDFTSDPLCPLILFISDFNFHLAHFSLSNLAKILKPMDNLSPPGFPLFVI